MTSSLSQDNCTSNHAACVQKPPTTRSAAFSLDLADALTPDPGTQDMFITENNKFAFSPGQLSKMLNPKSYKAFYAMGGLEGLEKGLRTG